MSRSAATQRTGKPAMTKEERFLADLQDFVWSTQGPGGTWQKLADKTGLSYGAVRNFGTGVTKRPHERTVRKLIEAAGYRTAYVPASMPTIVGELRLEKYRNVRRT